MQLERVGEWFCDLEKKSLTSSLSFYSDLNLRFASFLSYQSTFFQAREIVSTFPDTSALFTPSDHRRFAYHEPLYSADELLGIVSPNIKKPFDMREVIARLVDGSRWSEFKPLYGTSILCAWACIQGFLIGIIANR